MSEQLILPAAMISVGIFVAAVWLTRAGVRRAAASLIGVLAAAAVNVGWDWLAFRYGWWSYTFVDTPTAPLPMYVPVAFFFGAALGLVGWRVMRRWGLPGGAIFLAVYVVLGFARDHVIAARGDVFVFGPGATPHIIDAIGYLSLALVVQFAMLVLAGPPKRDTLRGRQRAKAPVKES